MDLQFIRDRISVLRTKKNVSEYRMSTDLGHRLLLTAVYHLGVLLY